MNNIKRVSIANLTAILVLVFYSCNTKNSELVKLSIITDKDKEIKVSSNDNLNLSPILMAEGTTDSTGTVTLTFQTNNSVFASFQVDNQWIPLFIEPGYDLTINLKDKIEGKIKFSGNGSTANNYLSETYSIYKTYERKADKFFWELPPSRFCQRLDSLKFDYSNFNNDYFNKTDLSSDVINVLQLNNRLRLISIKQNYLLAHPIDKIEINEVTSQLKSIATEIPLDNDLLKYQMFNYALVLQWHLDLDIYKPIWESNKANQNTELLPKLVNDSIQSTKNYPEQIKEFLIAKNIDHQMESNGLTNGIDSLLNDFKRQYPKSNYLETIQKRAEKWLAISPGRIAPDFKGNKLDGELLSLSDLRGKVIYIDVWATWCGPCKAEFPFSRKIQKSFNSDESVVFLYVSIDRDTEAWRKMVINDKEFTGLHIIQQDGQLWNSYLLNGIPRYILIDKEGKIVNPDAPRPSSGQIEGEIRQLLKS